jgi:hypothetical protein
LDAGLLFKFNLQNCQYYLLPCQSLFLCDIQRGVFVALDHRAKISGRDVLKDAAGFFDRGGEV